jgi:8-oxo-dGTP diphosphatase
MLKGRCSIKTRTRADSRRYPERPILGVGAIILNRNRVLLVERGSEPLTGYWSIPGGVLETGERLEEGIRREVHEETGLEIRIVKVVEIFERIMRDRKGTAEYHYVLIDYLCRASGGKLAASDDVARVEWVPRGDLKQYCITEGTLPVIEKAFRLRAKK